MAETTTMQTKVPNEDVIFKIASQLAQIGDDLQQRSKRNKRIRPYQMLPVLIKDYLVRVFDKINVSDYLLSLIVPIYKQDETETDNEVQAENQVEAPNEPGIELIEELLGQALESRRRSV